MQRKVHVKCPTLSPLAPSALLRISVLPCFGVRLQNHEFVGAQLWSVFRIPLASCYSCQNSCANRHVFAVFMKMHRFFSARTFGIRNCSGSCVSVLCPPPSYMGGGPLVFDECQPPARRKWGARPLLILAPKNRNKGEGGKEHKNARNRALLTYFARIFL